MQNNEKQIKNIPGENLPVISEDEQIQKNSMKLYVYLVSISRFEGRNKPRAFSQKDFSINKIHTITGLHDTTIKKYWRILEDNGLVVYQGPKIYATEQKEWEAKFMERKKNKSGFYLLPKREPYRIIPRETVEKLRDKSLEVSEQEVKLYFLLANMQEHFCYLKSIDREFTIADLRILLGLKKEDKNNKSIFQSLHWLKELQLIDYEIRKESNNLGGKDTFFELKQVNYYTDGGNARQILENNKEKLPAAVKQAILDEVLISFEV